MSDMLPAANHHAHRHAHPKCISEVIHVLKEKLAEEDRVSVSTLLHIFGVRSFAFLLFLFALLNIVIFMIPFSSILFGLPMVIIAVQIVLGFHEPVFPGFLRRRVIDSVPLRQGLDRALYGISKIEHYIRPRYTFLTHGSVIRVHGILTLALAVMVTLPIPFFNVPPSVGVALLAIGILQRDGVFIMLAYGVGLMCLLMFKSLGHMAHSVVGI